MTNFKFKCTIRIVKNDLLYLKVLRDYYFLKEFNFDKSLEENNLISQNKKKRFFTVEYLYQIRIY